MTAIDTDIPDQYRGLNPQGNLDYFDFESMDFDTFGEIMATYEEENEIEVDYDNPRHQLFYRAGEAIFESDKQITEEEIVERLEGEVSSSVENILNEEEVEDAMRVMRGWSPIIVGLRVDYSEGDVELEGKTYRKMSS